MEIFPYLLDVVLFAFAIYWSAANASANKGTPVFGLFRYREKRSETGKAAATPPGLRRLQLK